MHSWASVAISHLFRRAQFLIESAVLTRLNSRGFLPRRLSDAGLGVRGSACHRPASETLHKRRLPSNYRAQLNSGTFILKLCLRRAALEA